MKAHEIRRFVGISSVGVEHDPTSPFWYRNILQPMMRHTYADLTAMERAVHDSALDWTLVRPVRLTNGPLTQVYRTADGIVPNGTSIARADVADLIVCDLPPQADQHRPNRRAVLLICSPCGSRSRALGM